MSIYTLKSDIYKQYFSEPYHVDVQKADILKINSLGTDYAARLWGKDVFLPTTLRGTRKNGEIVQLDLDCCTIKLKGQKNVTKTQLSERRGSVKEIFSVDDYTIDIKGVLIGHDGVWPYMQVEAIRDLFETQKGVELYNALSDYFLQETKRVCITNINFYDLEAKSEKHIPFSMTMLSDFVEKLEFT